MAERDHVPRQRWSFSDARFSVCKDRLSGSLDSVQLHLSGIPHSRQPVRIFRQNGLIRPSKSKDPQVLMQIVDWRALWRMRFTFVDRFADPGCRDLSLVRILGVLRPPLFSPPATHSLLQESRGQGQLSTKMKG